MTNEPKTDKVLLDQLLNAAKQPVSSDTIRKQRVSFVFGNLPADNSMTRHQVRAALERLEGQAA